jgi:type II secretory pathway component PulJ
MRVDPGPPRSPHLLRSERGVGLMEVMVATIIAVVAVLALAYSFGAARGLVSRYEIARVALAAAQRRMEMLSALPPTAAELQIGRHPAGGGRDSVQVDGRTVVLESWQVEAYDDPADGPHPGEIDLKKVTATIVWGRLGPGETISLTRLFPAR